MLETLLALPIHTVLLYLTTLVSGLTCIMALKQNRQIKKQKRTQQIIHRRMQEDMRALSKSAIGMGQKIMDSERRLNELLKKQTSMINSQPEHPSYDQASRLIAMGATENDLVNSCGFSLGEAELLLSLNSKKPQRTAHMH